MDEYHDMQRMENTRAGVIAAAVCNAGFAKKKSGEPFTPSDFFSDLKTDDKADEKAIANRLLIFSEMAARSAQRKQMGR